MQARRVLPAGTWDAARETDRVRLDFDGRHRRRLMMSAENGTNFTLNLASAAHLRDGDGLELEDGRVVRVCAEPEPLLDIHAHAPGELARIAWHLGNRHLPIQVQGERLRIRSDHVIAEMVQRLGGHVGHVTATFDPEAGAYAGGLHQHDHDRH